MRDLFHYLQDPHLVARFQHICGVHGTFSGPTSDSKAGEGTDLHNSGARCPPVRGAEQSARCRCAGAEEGDRAQEMDSEVRKRSSDSTEEEIHEEGNARPPQNGSAGSAGWEAVGAAGEGVSLQGATPGSRTGVAAPPGSSTVKPLRKNSLTGDAGQEFVIENWFLYYLFTFGTELGNELFYITFFPFLAWNVDAFVSRRLIMVWVWVMYLGQCTKDVVGWSRPASPPVVKVEMFYNSEYSMPSTHAMSGTAIPFALFFMTYGRWEVSAASSVHREPPKLPNIHIHLNVIISSDRTESGPEISGAVGGTGFHHAAPSDSSRVVYAHKNAKTAKLIPGLI